MAFGSAAPNTQFLSASTRGKITIVLLAAVIISDLLGIFGGLGQLGLLARVAADGDVSTAEGEASDARMAMIGVFQMVAFWSCAIAFLSWLHRANRTARSFGTAYMEFTPAWAVGWWFVPFANLVRPFQAVNEVWKASSPHSTDATSWQAERTPPLLYAWWTFWLVGNFVANAYIRLSLRSLNEPSLDDLLMMTRVGIGSDVLTVVAGILAILVVAGINQRQDRKRILLQSAAQGGQPAGYPGAYQPAHGAGGYPQPAGPGGYTQATPSADPVAHYNQGVGYYQANDMARAIEEYKEAIRLNPNFAEAHYSLGLAYLAMGNTDAATIQASRLQSFSPEWSNKLYQLIRGR